MTIPTIFDTFTAFFTGQQDVAKVNKSIDRRAFQMLRV